MINDYRCNPFQPKCLEILFLYWLDQFSPTKKFQKCWSAFPGRPLFSCVPILNPSTSLFSTNNNCLGATWWKSDIFAAFGLLHVRLDLSELPYVTCVHLQLQLSHVCSCFVSQEYCTFGCYKRCISRENLEYHFHH